MSEATADLTVSREDTQVGIAARFATAGSNQVVHLEATVPLAADLTPWLPVALLAGMRQGLPVHLDGSVDQGAVQNTETVQRLMSDWHTNMKRIQVSADAPSDGPTATGVGCFFSGGVDSFHSVLRHQERITHLIFVRGFDIPLEDVDLGERASAAAREAAAELGIPLIEVSTNVRALSDPLMDWGTHFHGAALAMVALALADHLGEVIIPASYAEADLFAWGSHPELDPAYGSSRVRFVHDGMEYRAEKVRQIASSTIAMSHLRVCWENRGGAYNCGECEKCTRTIINLKAAGASERCVTLPQTLDLRAVYRLGLSHGGTVFARENIQRLSGSDRPVAWALQAAIVRSRVAELRTRAAIGTRARALVRR